MTDLLTRLESAETGSRELDALIADLSEPQIACLVAGNGDGVEAGMGVWFNLWHKGLLDDQLEVTELGGHVIAALRARDKGGG